MMSKTVVALALLEQANAFSAPVVRSRIQMFSEGDIGVTRPLGVYDPLGLISTRDMFRYEVMEIKHGRAAMLGFLHVILVEGGARFPGYISPTAGLKFSDVPSGIERHSRRPRRGQGRGTAKSCFSAVSSSSLSRKRPNARAHAREHHR